MSFTCPQCLHSNSLKITHSLELPYDSRSDEITLQIVTCSFCQFSGIAVYEESRRGALDSESVDHTGYRVNQEDLTTLRKLIRTCPHPKDPRCTCATHRKLGKRNPSGRWNGLADINLGEAFPMRFR